MTLDNLPADIVSHILYLARDPQMMSSLMLINKSLSRQLGEIQTDLAWAGLIRERTKA